MAKEGEMRIGQWVKGLASRVEGHVRDVHELMRAKTGGKMMSVGVPVARLSGSMCRPGESALCRYSSGAAR